MWHVQRLDNAARVQTASLLLKYESEALTLVCLNLMLWTQGQWMAGCSSLDSLEEHTSAAGRPKVSWGHYATAGAK
jgi:hypothetical protein